MTIAVYKRVSTDKQDMSMQDYAVSTWLKSKGWLLDAREYRDSALSGSISERPGFQAMCRAIEAGEITAVVVYRLDRLSRDAIYIMQLLMQWIQRGVEFYAVEQPILHLGKDNPFRLTILAIFSELAQVERETIVARVKAGLRAAKARGVKLGKQASMPDEQIRKAVELYRAGGVSVRDVERRTGVPKSTIHKYAKV